MKNSIGVRRSSLFSIKMHIWLLHFLGQLHVLRSKKWQKLIACNPLYHMHFHMHRCHFEMRQIIGCDWDTYTHEKKWQFVKLFSVLTKAKQEKKWKEICIFRLKHAQEVVGHQLIYYSCKLIVDLLGNLIVDNWQYEANKKKQTNPAQWLTTTKKISHKKLEFNRRQSWWFAIDKLFAEYQA